MGHTGHVRHLKRGLPRARGHGGPFQITLDGQCLFNQGGQNHLQALEAVLLVVEEVLGPVLHPGLDVQTPLAVVVEAHHRVSELPIELSFPLRQF